MNWMKDLAPPVVWAHCSQLEVTSASKVYDLLVATLERIPEQSRGLSRRADKAPSG